MSSARWLMSVAGMIKVVTDVGRSRRESAGCSMRVADVGRGRREVVR